MGPMSKFALTLASLVQAAHGALKTGTDERPAGTAIAHPNDPVPRTRLKSSRGGSVSGHRRQLR